MGTYPWGPHGPQAGAHDVTPNPTPAYVPPPESSGGWDGSAPTCSAPSGGGGGGGYSAPSAPTGPRKKSYIFAVILAAMFGPFGLLYTSFRGSLLVLTLMLGYPVALIMTGQPPGYYEPGLPISIWGNDAVMAPLWRQAVIASLLWTIIGVLRFNRKSKAAWEKAKQ